MEMKTATGEPGSGAVAAQNLAKPAFYAIAFIPQTRFFGRLYTALSYKAGVVRRFYHLLRRWEGKLRIPVAP
ncbi:MULTISPECIES: hypothetical protein [unclassified Cupriavidus]|uniref:hypothetical protein n=1 Tax=Cupriavidus sp. H19C3 TaxID=3241603 RepID=UPI003BF8B2E9